MARARSARSRAAPVEKLAALLFAALLFSRGASVWVEDWGFLRISSELWIPALVVLMQAPGRVAALVPCLCIAGWLALVPSVLLRL